MNNEKVSCLTDEQMYKIYIEDRERMSYACKSSTGLRAVVDASIAVSEYLRAYKLDEGGHNMVPYLGAILKKASPEVVAAIDRTIEQYVIEKKRAKR